MEAPTAGLEREDDEESPTAPAGCACLVARALARRPAHPGHGIGGPPRRERRGGVIVPRRRRRAGNRQRGGFDGSPGGGHVMTRVTHIDETVTIGGDLTVGRIGYGAMQL